MNSDTDEQTPSDMGLDLDPFGFIPEAQSRIPGLGGTMPPIDPSYAFHTPYVAVARGTVNFDLHFDNLKARRGTLTLRVHMLPDEPGSIARLVNSERVQLNRLAAQHGHISISTEGFRGVTYALVGAIPDDTDVSADGLTIHLDRQEDRQDPRAALTDARSTAFGNDLLKPSPHLLSMAEPRFDEPVSQAFTPRQLREARLPRQTGTPMLGDVSRWESAYVLQVFRHYGMLAEGAQGLCLLERPTATPALLAATGPSIHVIAQRNKLETEEPALLADELLKLAGVREARERLTASISDTLDLDYDVANFDFLYTDHLCDGLDVGRSVSFLDETINRLRPGGLSVHLLAADPLRSGRGEVQDGRMVYGRGDIEQIALTLISRGYEVARLRFGDLAAPRGATGEKGCFALVIRRPPSAL